MAGAVPDWKAEEVSMVRQAETLHQYRALTQTVYRGSIRVLLDEVNLEIESVHEKGIASRSVSLYSTPPFRGHNAEHVAVIETAYESWD